MTDLQELLKRSHLGTGLNMEELRTLSSIAQAKRIARGRLLFMEGDRAAGFYVLLEGRVRIYKAAAAGREYTIHQIRPGQMFAEVAIFHGERFPANCMALEDSRVAFFPKEGFLRLIKGSPQISLKIIGSMSAFLRDYNQQIADLSLKQVPARLAAHLLSEAAKRGGNEIHLEGSKAELARRLGTIGETLSRAFRKLRDSRIIEVDRNRISILETDRLSRIAEGEKI